ncbi:MAG: transcriptional regulator GcvA [Rhodocyclaceae bacterium]
MAYRLPPFPALRAFEAAARSLSFKAAAEELHVTPAAISQQVKSLEDYLGVRLFVRQTRRIVLTPEATAMLPKLQEAFECLAAAIGTTRRPGGTLTVSAAPNFAVRWLLPRLPEFSSAHPQINLRLSSSRNAIDAPMATAAAVNLDPLASDSEVSIRFGSGALQGHRCDAVLAPRYTLVCSPALLTGKRPLRTPADLRWHRLIHDDSVPDEPGKSGWEAWLEAAGAQEVDAARGPRFGNTTLAIEAALGAQGVVLALRQLVSADVAAGRLATPFDVEVSSRYYYYLAIPEAIAGRAVVQTFRTWLLEAAVEHASRGDLASPAAEPQAQASEQPEKNAEAG